MEFSRVGKHTIKCVITEDEIYDLGFTLDEVMGNGERTQAFMNQIFDMAEQEFETKFDLGIKTVRADFLSDHTLSLTFSEHPAGGDMMEHLKDIMNGLLSSIPKEKWEEFKELKNKVNTENVDKTSAAEDKKSSVKRKHPVRLMLAFESLDIVGRFASVAKVEEYPPSALYKFDNLYFLYVDMTEENNHDVKVISTITDEYALDMLIGDRMLAPIEEHGELIIKEKAIETLAQL